MKSFSVFTLAAIIGAAGLAGAGATIAPPSPAPAAPAARPDDGSEYKKIVDEAGPTLVTVKFTLKSEGEGGMGDNEDEITGVVIDPKGLVLCSYWSMGGAMAIMRGGPAPSPTDVKVLIGDDTEGKKAKVLSHDSELDLTWVQLDEAPATPLKAVNLEKAAAATMGQRVYELMRMDKYFDRAHVIYEGRIAAITEKPRHLYAPGRGVFAGRSDLGMPIFSADAGIVGFVVVQVPDKETMEASENAGGGPMILPAAEVAKATKRALEAHEKEGANKDEPKKEAPKPEAPKPEPEKK